MAEKTLKDMLAEARAVVPEEGPAEVQRRLAAGEPVALIDVRDPDEYRDGYIEPATNISRGFLEFRVGSVVGDPAAPVVVYCQCGLRSMLAAKVLKDLGYANVTNLQGGFQKWVAVRAPGGQGCRAGDRPAPALQPPLPALAGGREGAAQAAPLQACSSSAPAGWARRPRSTWPRPASAPSA